MPTKVRIAGTDLCFEATTGRALLDILQENGHPIATSCGGRASCGLCRLTVLSGKELLTSIKAEEIVHLGNVAKVIGMRLACQSLVCADGDVVVAVPAVEDVEERKRRKAERLRADRRSGRELGQAPRPARTRPGEASPPQAGLPAMAERIEWRPGRMRPKGD